MEYLITNEKNNESREENLKSVKKTEMIDCEGIFKQNFVFTKNDLIFTERGVMSTAKKIDTIMQSGFYQKPASYLID